MPDHTLLVALVETWHPLALAGLTGDASLIDENRQCESDSHDRLRLISYENPAWIENEGLGSVPRTPNPAPFASTAGLIHMLSAE
jgi:hypothetical protein